MPDAPQVTQLPKNPNTASPGGTYGDKASADRLKQGMGMKPTQPPPEPPPISALPGAAKPQPSSGPFGLPPAITAPTNQPDVPVSTPLAQPSNPVADAGSSPQKRLAFLDMLARDPDVSDETREFAQLLISKLIEASKR